MKISIIAAMSENFVIGLNNKLPDWKIPGDLKRFKSLTLGKTVLMGRKTYESIGKPLPDRTNIVVSSMCFGRAPNCYFVKSFEEGLKLAQSFDNEVMVIGGAKIYEQAMPYASTLFLTILHENWDGDTFFPRNGWSLQENNVIYKERHERHSFVTLEKEPTRFISILAPVHTAVEPTKENEMNNKDNQAETYKELGEEIGALVDEKNKAYGSAFDDAGQFLMLLYPNGINPSQYGDALALVRIFDKQKRIATDADAFGESPYGDIAGYGLLGLKKARKAKKNKVDSNSLKETIDKMEEKFGKL